MIIKNVNGFVYFTFQSVQEMELLMDILPIPELVPLENSPMTYIPKAQATSRYVIAGVPLSPLAIPIKSNADVVKGFKDNMFTYSFSADGIIPYAMVTQKVMMSINKLGKYYSNFMLQPYALVGVEGRASDYECVYNPDTGLYIYNYIRFTL